VRGWLLSNALVVVMKRKGDANRRNVLDVVRKRPLRRRHKN
jgi:hypothetical protein